MVKATGMLCYVFAAMIAGYACWSLFISGSVVSVGMGKMLLISVLIAVPILMGTAMIVSSKRNIHEKCAAVRRIMVAAFLLYCAVLCFVLFTVGKWSYGDGGVTSHNYVEFGVNLFPLSALGTYFDRVVDYSGSIYITVQAVFSGLIGFMPMGIFLPCIWPKLKNWKTFIFSMVIILSTIEVVQLLFKLGRFDIYDLILNLLGALIVFCIVRLEEVQRALSRVYFMEYREERI